MPFRVPLLAALSGCGLPEIDEATACHAARWQLAERAAEGRIRDVHDLACRAFNIDPTAGRASIEVTGSWEAHPGKGTVLTLDEAWEPRTDQAETFAFGRGPDGWHPADGGKMPPEPGKPGTLAVNVRAYGPEGSSPLEEGRCRTKTDATVADGRCEIPDVRAGDVLTIIVESPGIRPWTHLIPVTAGLLADGADVEAIRLQRATLVVTDALTGAAIPEFSVAGGELGPIAPNATVSVRVSAAGYTDAAAAIAGSAAPPWATDTAVTMIPALPDAPVLVGGTVGGVVSVPASPLKQPLHRRERYDAGKQKPDLPLSDGIPVVERPWVVVRGTVDGGNGLIRRERPEGRCGGLTRFGRESTGWVLLPVVEWKGGALPDATAATAGWTAVAEPGLYAGAIRLAKSGVCGQAEPIEVDWAVTEPAAAPAWAASLPAGTTVLTLPESGLWALSPDLGSSLYLIRYAPPAR